jgi:hypothetical protein
MKIDGKVLEDKRRYGNEAEAQRLTSGDDRPHMSGQLA